MEPPQIDLSTAPGTSRRTFLTRSAAGAAAGGLLWVAPSVLTVDAAAAASCGSGATTDWAALTDKTDPGSISAGSVTMSIAHTDPNGVAYTDSWDVLTGTFGGQSAWYEMQMNGATTGDLQTLTLTFNETVNGLKLTFLDIDQNDNSDGSGRWRDIVSVVATGPGGNVTWTNTAKGNNLTGAGTTGDPYIASNNENTPNGNTNGNVTLNFDAGVTSIVVTYKAGKGTHNRGTGPWSEQRIGIANLSWTSCS